MSANTEREVIDASHAAIDLTGRFGQRDVNHDGLLERVQKLIAENTKLRAANLRFEEQQEREILPRLQNLEAWRDSVGDVLFDLSKKDAELRTTVNALIQAANP